MDKMKTKSYVLGEEEILIIGDLQEQKNLSASSALRIIIREWADSKAGMVTVNVTGIVKDGKVVPVNSDYWKTDKGIEQSR